MKRRHLWGGGLLLGGLTVGLAPASLLTDAASSNSAGLCRFAEVSGYWWQGSADLYVANGGPDRSWQGLGRLRWRLGWQGMGLNLGSGHAELRPGWDSLSLQADAIRLPAGSLLAHLGHGLPQAGWGGTLTATDIRLRFPWSKNSPNGTGRILWERATTSLMENLPLGDYHLTWNVPTGRPWQGTLGTGQGPLHLAGELTLSPFRLSADARLDAGAERLKKYLDLVAQPGGADNYHIDLPR